MCWGSLTSMSDLTALLREKGLRSVTILPLGYRQEDGDWLVKLPKIRRPRGEFVTEVR